MKTLALLKTCIILITLIPSPSLFAQTYEKVTGFREPKPGEHPRLFFRKSDLPEIRRRAFQTEEGKAIVQQLLNLLGKNGWELPDDYNQEHPRNNRAKGPDNLPVGAFTMSHAAGYGMLYQLTGRKHYATLAQQSLEMMFRDDLYSVDLETVKKERGKFWEPPAEWKGKNLSTEMLTYGQPDRDERYTWSMPGTVLRVGPMMAWVALAYDLCYEAWTPQFRERVADEILEYNHRPAVFDGSSYDSKGPITIETLVNCSYKPQSNHFGAYIGGSGIALLALRNDPEVNRSKVDDLLDRIDEQTLRFLQHGFGDRGFFAEGHGPSHLAANTAFVPFLQAARVSWGRDYIGPNEGAQWISLRWAMEVIPGNKAWYPNFHPSSYGPEFVDHGTLSSGGEWSQGFGALANRDQQSALLWTYLNAIEKERPLENYDAWIYPHRAILALINWPTDLEPVNPGEVLDNTQMDAQMGHVMFRNRWQDGDDLYFAAFLNPNKTKGHMANPRGGNFRFFGYGIRSFWPQPVPPSYEHRKITDFHGSEDGSGYVVFENGDHVTGITVDYTGKSGLGGVVLFADPWFSEADYATPGWNDMEEETNGDARLDLAYQQMGDKSVFIMTLGKGPEPKITTGPDWVQINNARYRYDGKKLLPQ